MCVIDVDGGDWPEFYNKRLVVARKQHKCCECGEDILPGQQYEVVVGKWDGEFSTYKTCSVCLELRTHFFCTWVFGTLYEELIEELEEGGFSLGHMDNLSPAAAAKIDELMARLDEYEEADS